MAHMYIMNPLAGRRGDSLFSTHPATQNRIESLQRLAAEMGVEPTSVQPRRAAGPWG